MAVDLELFFFLKPGQELNEGQPVTPQQVRDLARSLHDRLTRVARTLDVLGGQGWPNEMGLYSVTVYPQPDIATATEAVQVLKALGVELNDVVIYEPEDEGDLHEEHLENSH